MIDRPFVQLAYCVNDVFEAVKRWHALHGAGPFFVNEHIPVSDVLYRGQPGEFDHTSAYGQMGDVMLELVQQNNDGPSAIRDMFAPGEEGLHHCATFVESFEGELTRYESLGYEVANKIHTAGGVGFAFIDARKTHGHMIEVYEGEKVRPFYELVEAAAQDWDGSELVRKMG